MRKIDHSKLRSYIESIDFYENTAEGIKQARHALRMAELYGDKDLSSRAHHRVSALSAYEGTRDEEEFHANEALRLSLDVGNIPGAVSNLENLANLFINHGDVAKAFEFRKQALRNATEHNIISHLPGVLCNMGADYNWMGDYEKALECYQEALRISLESKNRKGIAQSYEALAIAFLNQDLFDLATENALKALEYSDGPNPLTARTQNTLSRIYLLSGNFTEAEKAASLASAYHRRTDKKGGNLALTLASLGSIYLKQRRLDRAKEVLLEAVQLANKSELYEGQFDSYVAMADLSIEENDLKFALHWCDRANNIAIGRDKAEIGKRRYLLLKKQGDFEGAIECLEDIHNLESVDMRETYQKRIAMLRVEHEVSKKESETNLLRLRGEHLETELSNSTLQLIAQTELLSELRDGLLQVIRKFPMPDAAARELRDRLKTLPCKAVNWEKFDTQFRAAHPEFTKKLIEQYPMLSPTELRICSLVRMNLKSEDIARLLCLSERSVEGHRTHVRKKMNLPRTEDLMVHLAKM